MLKMMQLFCTLIKNGVLWLKMYLDMSSKRKDQRPNVFCLVPENERFLWTTARLLSRWNGSHATLAFSVLADVIARVRRPSGRIPTSLSSPLRKRWTSAPEGQARERLGSTKGHLHTHFWGLAATVLRGVRRRRWRTLELTNLVVCVVSDHRLFGLGVRQKGSDTC